MVEVKRQWPHLSGTLFLSSLVSVTLFVAGAMRGHYYGYAFMVWNLFLAWLPLLFILWLQRMLRRKRWSSWQGIILSVLWLGFLPNTFYMITDYIHLFDVPSVDLVYDAVMLTSFVTTGLVLGFASLYIFHIELRKRIPTSTANRIVAFILLLSSFAIYLGRDLRWNTWDLFLNPAGILFDLSNQFISPNNYPSLYITTLSFFVLLAMLYIITWNLVSAIRMTTIHSSQPTHGGDKPAPRANRRTR